MKSPYQSLGRRRGPLISDLAEEVRAIKRRKLRPSSFAALEYALDKVILPELGQLRAHEPSPDRIVRLLVDLEAKGLKPSTIRRYLSPLSLIFKLAIRRGDIVASPITLLSDEERPSGGGVRDHYVWTRQEIGALVAAADELGRRPQARYNYGPLIRLLALTGLRVAEALALQWADVDLDLGELHVTRLWTRTATMAPPKTKAGTRNVPLSAELVDLLTELKRDRRANDPFVFASRAGGSPVSYWNFRRRGFGPALAKAGLNGRGITIHDLRSAAASFLIQHDLTPVEVARLLGHADPNVTLRVYARLFDAQDVASRVRRAQSAILS